MEFQKIAENLYAQIAAAVGIDDNIEANTLQRSFITFFKPGIPLTQKCLDACQDLENNNDYLEDIYYLTNQTSTLERIFDGNVTNNAEINSDYALDKLIQHLSTHMSVVHYELTDAQKEKQKYLNDEISKLENDSNYLKAQESLEDLVDQFGKMYYLYQQGKIKKAEDRTLEEITAVKNYNLEKSKYENKFPQKWNEIKKHESQIDAKNGQLLSLDSLSFMDDKQRIYQKSILPLNQAGKLNFFVPRDFGTINGQKSWTEIEISDKTIDIIKSLKTSGGGGRGSFLGGLFGISGGGGGSWTVDFNKTTINDYYIKFKITKVRIVRPWFESNFINESWWDFENDDIRQYYQSEYEEWNNIIKKDGEPDAPLFGKKGFIMGYPTDAIFISDLELRLKYSDDTTNHSISDQNYSAGFSWGPFRIGGNYFRHTDEKFQTIKTNDGTLKVNGIQLLGFVNKFFPLLPHKRIDKHKDHYVK